MVRDHDDVRAVRTFAAFDALEDRADVGVDRLDGASRLRGAGAAGMLCSIDREQVERHEVGVT